MKDLAKALGAKEQATTLLVLFVPSKDRDGEPIDQKHWAGEAIEALARLFGSATAFPPGRGVWRDDGGELLVDSPVVIHCYATEKELKRQAAGLREFLHRLGTEARQRAVGLAVGLDYLEIEFPEEG